MMPHQASGPAHMPQPYGMAYGASVGEIPYPGCYPAAPAYPGGASASTAYPGGASTVYPDGGAAGAPYAPSYPAPGGAPPQPGFIGGSFGLPPAANLSPNSVGMGAVFKKRMEKIDWRKIASLDVDRIARDMDVQSLQDNLMNITFCNIESEVDCRNMDPNFTKLFKLSQLSIEYMLYSQEYLANVMAGLESRLGQIQLDHENTRRELEKQKNELVQVKKESHKRKKLLAAQQQILHSGAQAYHKCPFCPKAFVHESFCASHIQRRHADQAGSVGVVQSAPVSPQRDQASHVERELMELKERLRFTERQLIESERNKSQFHSESHVDEQQRMMESWKAKERERQREEFESIRQMFLSQFEDLNQKYMESERQLLKIRGKSDDNRPVSNLGDLADDTDTETERVRSIRSANIKNLLTPERPMKDQMDTQTFTIEQRNQQEIARLDAVLRSSRPAVSPPASQPNTPSKSKSDHTDAVMAFSPGREMEEVMTREGVATAASAAKELPMMSQHNELIKTAPASSNAMKRSLSPSSPILSPRSGSPAKKQKDRPVYDRSDDDIDDEDESELQEMKEEFAMWTNEEALKGALSQSTLDSTGPHDDRLGTDDSLIATIVRSARLTNQLNKDPGLLRGLKEELNQVLDEQLEEKGITKDLTGISNVVLNNKLELMEKDREIMDRKYANFYKIRRQYERKVDREARLKWEEMKENMPKQTKKKEKKVKSSKSSSMPNLAAPKAQSPAPSPVAPRKAQTPTAKKATVPRSPRSPVVIKKESAPPAPQAQPRTSMTLSTEYSSAIDTQDDDYSDSEGEYTEDTDGNDEVDLQKAEVKVTESKPRLIMSGPAPASGPPAPPPRSPEHVAPTTPKTPREEISDWDSTEMSSEVKPTVRANVKQLSASVDSQLKNRSPGERPFGGVNTLPGSKPATRHVRIEGVDDEDDLDLSISVSSLQEVERAPAPAPRHKGVHASGEGEFSTNTGGTSVWGSVSKAPGAPLVGVGKSSQSLTDWDSDLDIDDL